MLSVKCQPSFLSLIVLTLKHRETQRQGCVVSTVATDALVLKHQAISIHNADIHCIGLVSYKDIAHKVISIRKWNHILKKVTQSFMG